jgi:hypothetical protein
MTRAQIRRFECSAAVFGAAFPTPAGAASARTAKRMPPDSQMTWTLTDLRRWLTSPACHRWARALGLAPARNLTNFGDLV